MQSVLKAKEIFNQGKVEQVSESIWKSDEHTVKLHKKVGRKFYTCDCKNFSRFCNSNVICSHIESVILFQNQDPRLKKLIREMKEHAEKSEEFGVNIEPSYVMCISDDLRRFI